MQIRHRCSHFIRMMIFPEEHFMCSLFQELLSQFQRWDVISGKVADDSTAATLNSYITGEYGEPGSERADSFTIEQLLGKSEPKSRAATNLSNEMLSLIDVLVDGPYVESLHDITLKFRGSSNQRVIDIKKTISQKKIVLYLE